MKRLLFAAASLLIISTPVFASTVSVATDPAAPTGNFQAAGNTATAGYDLTLSDNGSSIVGVIAQTGGDAVGAFANLYFDLNPTVGDGSDLGFEMGSGGVTAFIPGKNGQAGFSTTVDPTLYTFSSATAGGLTTLDFSLANSLFTAPIAGLSYYGPADGSPVQTFENVVTLRLSQSLSYSVAGGDSYGDSRLGSVTVGTGAVPEPATWAMMLIGFAGLGAVARRRRALIAA
jgi:PEP-CTERM motif